jgi:RNA polymerase sigma factor (sigma-70 family)
MSDLEMLAGRFEQDRAHLRAVAQRILGSEHEADDAVQEAWVRLSRSDTTDVGNLTGWLTTVVSRVCLDMLRSRTARREDPAELPETVVAETADPEHEAVLADSIGPALMLVLNTLNPNERLAFVLHDMFAVPFPEIAEIVGCTPAAARQLASRGRRRVQGSPTGDDVDAARTRTVVKAFLAASRGGDFAALLAVLDPDVVLRSDGGTARPRLNLVLRGRTDVAGQALASSRLSPFVRPALINGAAGVVVAAGGRTLFLMAFTVSGGKVAAIDVIADPDRLAAIDLTVLDR